MNKHQLIRIKTRLPFFPLLFCAIAGIFAGSFLIDLHLSTILIGTFFVLTIITLFTKNKYFRYFSLMLLLLVLFSFYYNYRNNADIAQQNLFSSSEKTPIIARGYLLDMPLPLKYSEDAEADSIYASDDDYYEFEYSLSNLYCFRFHVDEYFDGINSIAIDETILIHTNFGFPELPTNKKIEIPLRVFNLAIPLNPGEFDYGKYQRELGIMRYADYDIKHDYKVLDTKPIDKLSMQRFAINTRVALTKIALKLPANHSALFLTLTIGNTTMLSKITRDDFRLTGTLHLLVISGLHIGFLVFILEILLKFFRVSQRTKAIILLLLLIFYWLVVGYKISITRAIIIGIIYYFGQLLRKQVKFSNVLAAAAFFVLIINPYELFHIGFYLSFSAVFFIKFLFINIYKTIVIKDNSDSFINKWQGVFPFLTFLFKDVNSTNYITFESDFFITKWRRFCRFVGSYIRNSIKLSIAAVMGTMPIIWWKFGVITPGAFIMNLVAIPLMLWILGFSMLVFVFQLFITFVNTILFEFGYDFFLTDIINQISLYLTKASCFGIELLLEVERFIVELPGCYFFVPKLSLFTTLLLYLFFLAIVFHRKFRVKLFHLIIIISIFASAFTFEMFWTQNTNNLFLFTQLSGRRKSCSIIQTSDNKVILVDNGSLEYESNAKKLLQTLHYKNIKKIDLLIMQPTKLDAIEGYLLLIRNHFVQKIILTQKLSNSFVGEYLVEAASKFDIDCQTASAGTEIAGFNKLHIKIISPPAEIQEELFALFEPEFSLSLIMTGEFGSIVFAGNSSDLNYNSDMLQTKTNKISDDTKILVLPSKLNKSITFENWFNTFAPTFVISSSHNKIPDNDRNIIANKSVLYETKYAGAVTYSYDYQTKQERIETFIEPN